MRRVLLVNPARNYVPGRERKVCTQPLGLAYIAAVTRQAGYDVRIIDATAEGYDNESPAKNGFIRYGLSCEELRRRIEAYQPDVVGVGCVQSLQLYEAYEVFDIVKAVNPGIVTVFGGGHATALYEQEAGKNHIDYVAVGEGEITFPALLTRLEEGPLKGEFLPGIAYRADGRLVYSGGPRVENLDELPRPAYDLLPMSAYRRHQASPSSFTSGLTAIMQTSRGCPHHCQHCPVHEVFGKGYRRRSVSNVVDEVEWLVGQYGVDEICIEDSNFTIGRARAIDFCRQVRNRGIDVRFSLPHGIEVATLDGDLLAHMREAGFYALHLSIESANDTVLSTQDKQIATCKVLDVIRTGRELGFRITAYFMIGFPDETRADIDRTVEFAGSLDVDKVNFFIYTPLPGTPLFEECRRDGLFVEDFDITHLRYAIANINGRHIRGSEVERIRSEAWQKIMGIKRANVTVACSACG